MLWVACLRSAFNCGNGNTIQLLKSLQSVFYQSLQVTPVQQSVIYKDQCKMQSLTVSYICVIGAFRSQMKLHWRRKSHFTYYDAHILTVTQIIKLHV